MGVTTIEWADYTFNPWVGCSKVSPGCEHCYAEAQMDKRLGKVKWGPTGTRIRTSDANWRKPLKWNRDRMVQCDANDCGYRWTLRHETEADTFCPECGHPGAIDARPRVFCASLADVFEMRGIDLSRWRVDLFGLIEDTPNLDWLLLTKRPQNAARWMTDNPPSNLWLGVSVEDQATADKRIPILLETPAAVRFVSYEPALGPVDFSAFFGGEHVVLPGDATEPSYNFGVDWVIVGGESGPNARPCNLEWIAATVQQCRDAGVAVFVKQVGSRPYTPTGFKDEGMQMDKHLWAMKDSKGGDPEEWPEDLRVRESLQR